jgi:MFS family permease
MENVVTRKFRFARALRFRAFSLLWLGQSISLLGDSVYIIALAWTVLQITGSAVAMSFVIIASIIPTLIFVLIGGALADRLPRRLVMIWSDTFRAAFVFIVAFLAWVHLLQLWHLVVLAVLFGIADSFFSPAYRSIPPLLIEKEDLPSANGLLNLARQVSILLGPLLGALFMSLGGSGLAFAFDGGSFLVSALCLLVMNVPSSADLSVSSSQEQEQEAAVSPGIVAEVREGLKYVAGSTWLWFTILVASVANIGYSGPMTIALPKLIRYVYHVDVWLLGVLGATSAVGAILSTLVIGQLKDLRYRGIIAYLAVIASGFALLLFGLPLSRTSAIIMASIGSLLAGFSLGVFQIIWVTVLQELVPVDKLGRVSSVDMLGSYCLLPIGFVIVGILADKISPSWVFIGGGILVMILAVSALFVRDIRRLM